MQGADLTAQQPACCRSQRFSLPLLPTCITNDALAAGVRQLGRKPGRVPTGKTAAARSNISFPPLKPAPQPEPHTPSPYHHPFIFFFSGMQWRRQLQNTFLSGMAAAACPQSPRPSDTHCVCVGLLVCCERAEPAATAAHSGLLTSIRRRRSCESRCLAPRKEHQLAACGTTAAAATTAPDTDILIAALAGNVRAMTCQDPQAARQRDSRNICRIGGGR